MAITADVVEVRLRADTDRYVRDLNTAGAASTRTISKIGADARTSGQAFTALGANATAGFQQVVDGAQRAQQATATAQSSFSGVAAQFQDIGVTAAAGMNPLIIALQQGTQLSAQLQLAASRGGSVLGALRTGLVGLINPISISTIAIIALGTAAAQYLGQLISQGQVSNETLKEQESLIRDVADNWGEAVPALRAYVDQLDRAKATGDLSTATDIAIDKQYEDLIGVVGNLRAEFAAARIDIQQLGGDAQEIDVLQAAFDALEEKARAGTATAADLESVVALIGQTSGATSPGIISLAGVLGGLAGAFAEAARQAQVFREQRDAALAPTAQIDAFNSNREFIAEQERLNALTADQLALENEVNRVKASAERSDVPISDAQALTVATENLAAAERRRAEAKALADATKSGAKAETEADREAAAVLKLIEQLQFEYDIIGLTNEQRAVANALRQAGAAATGEQRKEIEALVTATLVEREALAQLEETTQMWAKTAQDATRGFIDDLIEGKSAAEALGNVLKNLGSQLINIGLSNLFGPSGFNFGGARANGGPVSGGSTYLVGERGPELFTPSSGGRITSNADMQGGGGVTVQMSNDFRGVDAASVARIEAGLERLAANIVPTVRREIAVGPKKGRR